MLEIILFTSLLYFVQTIAKYPLVSREGASSERAEKAVHNLRESLPVFISFAILSIHLNVEANILVAQIWLALRVAFALIYISGFNQKPVQESGYVPQPLRSGVWFGSIVCLIVMASTLV
jgi:uncharacterized MAPEG superfamily protein